MKQGNIVTYILRLALTLLLITAVVAGLLSVVNGVTAPIIEDLKEKKTQAAIEAVLPGGGQPVEFSDATGTVLQVYKGEKGYAVQVAPQGFNGPINMMVGVDNDGKVLDISIISQAETAGLGAICAAKNAAGEKFRDSFKGLSGQLSVSKDGGDVDTITSATITSRAVTAGVNAALECVANMG